MKLSLNECDYVLVSVGYTDRLFTRLLRPVKEVQDAIRDFKEYGEENRMVYVATHNGPVLVDGSQEEVKKIQQFLKRNNIEEYDCLCITSNQAHSFIDSIMQIGHCACFCWSTLYEFDIYKEDDMSVALIVFDTESG